MVKVILGLQFGDEGKGITTDYLCSECAKPIVIRFCGGHQVGHTVVTDKIEHVFSNFGSGTLKGAPTYWTHYCTVDPIGLVKELKILKGKGVEPILYISNICPVVTPLDKTKNIKLEDINKHGSCGVGFGTTLQREKDFYSLTFIDLLYPSILKAKMREISVYYNMELENNDFFEACDYIRTCENIKPAKETQDEEYSDYIFEGSQGIMLDQNIGVFPNVTRSNTDLTNFLSLNKEEFEVYLVTRAYQTRHGNGFMTNEDKPHNIKVNPKETNVDNEYQGKFRRTLLDVSLLEYVITRQEKLFFAKNVNLVITCLDHITEEYRFTYKENIVYCDDENDFIEKITNILKIKKFLVSRSNNSKNMEWGMFK